MPGIMNGLKLAAAFLLAGILTGSSFAQTKTEVFVLSALHQFHGKDNTYTFDRLSEIVEGYAPDIIAVELTPSDLANRKNQKTKQEYQNSIFSVADRLKATMVPMEPVEPEFSRLVGLIRASEAEVRETWPVASESFSTYTESLYKYLFDYWRSACEVNSPVTDALFEVKHDFQNRVFGDKQQRGWEGWNSHFLGKILDAAKENPGKRIIVIVGAEHSYWLRKELRGRNDLVLVEPGKAIRCD